jgi:ADP-ribose pyrophosphatase YjhB (NUDIX family)
MFNGKPEYLMIRRKDTFGYIDFIRGKYSLKNMEQIKDIIDEMSNEEKGKIITHSFEKQWQTMWGNTNSLQHKTEESNSGKRFKQLTTGFMNDTEEIKLSTIVEQSTTNWTEAEWEFPKGRKKIYEKDYECAIREFGEETGILMRDITLVQNVMPFVESFIGTNYKSYKHKYFLAFIKNNDIDLTHFQSSEVSNLGWKSFDTCLEVIRPYNFEKINLITRINNVLEKYEIISI